MTAQNQCNANELRRLTVMEQFPDEAIGIVLDELGQALRGIERGDWCAVGDALHRAVDAIDHNV